MPQNQLGLPEIFNGLWEFQNELQNTTDAEPSQKSISLIENSMLHSDNARDGFDSIQFPLSLLSGTFSANTC